MASATKSPPAALLTLRSAAAVRERCARILDAAHEDRCAHFSVDASKLDAVAQLVVDATRARYPSLQIPLHSRMGHFGAERVTVLRSQIDPARWADAALDLVMVSVLLDAGAGPSWRFHDAATGETIGRSEGLAVASLRAFEAGLFSAHDGDPLRVDADALRDLRAKDLIAAFGVTDDNPLVGVDGRVALMHGLADALRKPWFANHRPCGLREALAVTDAPVPAAQVLAAVLSGLANIWPSRHALHGYNLGDVWKHPYAGGEGESAGWVPLHKLSQWLTYSLVEPLRAGGLEITDLDGLTGLAEYRNGGLFVDEGVLIPRDPAVLREPQDPYGPIVVEWRALTVALLDVLAPTVRALLGLPSEDFPLGCVLEGGTWAAGRKAASSRRPDGSPPIKIASDGTLF